jgi:hypothetical protein
MHGQKEESLITSSRETERLNGELEIDYQRNTVKFHPSALCEFSFSLPLTPSEVDVVRSLTQISRRLETQRATHPRAYETDIAATRSRSCQS